MYVFIMLVYLCPHLQKKVFLFELSLDFIFCFLGFASLMFLVVMQSKARTLKFIIQ